MSVEIRRSNGRVWLVDLARGEQILFEDDLVGAALSAEERRASSRSSREQTGHELHV